MLVPESKPKHYHRHWQRVPLGWFQTGQLNWHEKDLNALQTSHVHRFNVASPPIRHNPTLYDIKPPPFTLSHNMLHLSHNMSSLSHVVAMVTSSVANQCVI